MTGIPYGEIGVAGILIVLVLKLVFDFLGPIGKRKNAACTKTDDMIVDLVATVHTMRTQIVEVRDQIQGLHKQHDRRMLDTAIAKLSDNIGLQTDILREMASESREAHRDIGAQLTTLKGV